MLVAGVSTGMFLVLIVLVALPLGAVVFAFGAGDAFDQIGKGDLSIGDQGQAHGTGGGGPAAPASSQVREQEIRQMVQARSDRAVARGSEAIDVDAEVERLLSPERPAPSLGADDGLREEVRQLVVAGNERRVRAGKRPLDVEGEVERQLSELENLGQ